MTLPAGVHADEGAAYGLRNNTGGLSYGWVCGTTPRLLKSRHSYKYAKGKTSTNHVGNMNETWVNFPD